jgi:hypothetical protein
LQPQDSDLQRQDSNLQPQDSDLQRQDSDKLKRLEDEVIKLNGVTKTAKDDTLVQLNMVPIHRNHILSNQDPE